MSANGGIALPIMAAGLMIARGKQEANLQSATNRRIWRFWISRRRRLRPLDGPRCDACKM